MPLTSRTDLEALARRIGAEFARFIDKAPLTLVPVVTAKSSYGGWFVDIASSPMARPSPFSSIALRANKSENPGTGSPRLNELVSTYSQRRRVPHLGTNRREMPRRVRSDERSMTDCLSKRSGQESSMSAYTFRFGASCTGLHLPYGASRGLPEM